MERSLRLRRLVVAGICVLALSEAPATAALNLNIGDRRTINREQECRPSGRALVPPLF